MARIARAVASAIPDHVTQRGNGQQRPADLFSTTRYVEFNPVGAGLVQKPEDWRWSSAGAHIKGKDDMLVKNKLLLDMVSSPWKRFLSVDAHEWEISLFQKHERTGRPLGDQSFIEKLEQIVG